MLYEILLLASPQAVPVGETSIETKFKRHRDWDYELIEETFRPVGTGFTFEGSDRTFLAKLEGTSLLVDLDGDGQTDAKVEAPDPKEPGEESNVLLRGDDGFRYAARLRMAGGSWVWSAGCARVGKLGTSQVQLIDANANGRYDEVGVDALVVGRGSLAQLLGETIPVEGVLHQLEVAADGSAITLAPYTGTTGKLDVRSAMKTQAKVLSAVVQSADGRHCFDLARAEEGQSVPAGEYEILAGRLALGELEVAVGPGTAPNLTVTPEADTTFEWGGPVRAEFAFQRAGDEVGFSPDAVWYYGNGGEQYTRWWPVGKSPEFVIKNQVTQKEVARAMFPGSC